MRIDSYESKEAQQVVRNFLDGRFENTAFCILSPDGEKRLTEGGRGPHQVFRRADLANALQEISREYQMTGQSKESFVPDFPTFRLGLNVASADQRLLVLVTGSEKEISEARKRFNQLSNDAEIIGRFHYDFETDESSWKKVLKKSKSGAQIMIISPETYGQGGEVMKSLALDSEITELKVALLAANETFAKETKKKSYSTHVRSGKKMGVTWKMPIEYGEDRDGDGKIDFRGPPRRRRR